eukprot:4243653-Heterocapsa_arctica.AAC.1
MMQELDNPILLTAISSKERLLALAREASRAYGAVELDSSYGSQDDQAAGAWELVGGKRKSWADEEANQDEQAP